MPPIVKLHGASDRLYMTERGVLDSRARLALTNGQCHGLALAIRRKTGWPLVAIDNADGVCEHICVQRDDGKLLDINGAHDPEALVDPAAGRIQRPITEAEIRELATHHGWAAADEAGAEPWVPAVLAASGLPPWGAFGVRLDAGQGVEVLVRWEGKTYMDVYVRRQQSPNEDWTFYSHVLLPRDPETQRHIIDFSEQAFQRLAESWVSHQFELAKADRILSERAG